MQVDPRRIRTIQKGAYNGGPVLYWMNRDMRIHDNWALLYALELAAQYNERIIVFYNLHIGFLGGGQRQAQFKLDGLQEIQETCRAKKIAFILEEGEESHKKIEGIARKYDVGAIVTDFSPLKLQRKWLREVRSAVDMPLWQVDAHNIVPAWEASDKQEYAAYTIRKKIMSRLGEFATDFPLVRKQESAIRVPAIDWPALQKKVDAITLAPRIESWKAGEKAAKRTMNTFLEDRLRGYAEKRNDPNEDAQSNLSPYLHYGMIAAQRVVVEAGAYGRHTQDYESFIEELVVRKELSDNFCYYNTKYDSFDGFPEWAQKTLNKHRGDAREYVYAYRIFETAQTHDPLWNAAQQELLQTGKMHGYMRMYWAKKILEWTKDPETAQRIAIKLNDIYEMDGRDPNGYAGIAWSIGGVHDRAWTERPVFGTIRFMNDKGCKRKFDTESYITRFTQTSLFG